MNQIILNLIIGIHTLFVLFVTLTPFLGNPYLLMLHTLIIPFMMLHWLLNDNTCALTTIEKMARTKLYGTVDENDCFTCKLIQPVYDFKKNNQSSSGFIYLLTTTLWLISVYKLFNKFKNGEITRMKDIFRF